MRWKTRPHRLLWPAIMLAVGLAMGRFWPETPLGAVATDSNSVCMIATGAMDLGIEAVFVLDAITGELKAGVLSRRNGAFRAQYRRNITGDFEMPEGKKMQFLLVTGNSDLIRPPTGARFGGAVVYVAEVNSGVIRAYGVPWVPQLHAQDQPVLNGVMMPLGKWKFRGAEIREP